MLNTNQTAKKAIHYHMVNGGVWTQSFVYFRSENKVKTIRNLKIFNFLLNIRNMQQKIH